MNKQLAKVTHASLYMKENGIFNFWINVDYEDGGCQGIGGLVLDRYDQPSSKRVGTAYGCEMIRQILMLFDVNDFSEIAGKNLWVLGTGSGFSFTPCGIQSLKVDGKQKTLIFDEIKKEFVNKMGKYD